MPDRPRPSLKLPFSASLVPRQGPRAGHRIPLESFEDGVVRFAELTADGVAADSEAEIFWNDRGYWLCDLAASGRVKIERQGRGFVTAEPVVLDRDTVFSIDGVEYLLERSRRVATVDPNVPLAFLEFDNGQRVQLGRSTAIGRHPDNDTQILDSQMSRRHAVITYDEAKGFLLRHMSPNPTSVNGTPVSAEGRLLRAGDVVVLGQTRMRFVLEDKR